MFDQTVSTQPVEEGIERSFQDGKAAGVQSLDDFGGIPAMLLDAREYERFEHPPADGGKLCIFGHEATVTQYSSCTQSYSFIGRFRPWLP
ncbi:hypothetical protein, partial [Sphingobium sp. ZW T5_29]|uniref:hypothetical protein n=1 Tax=Sphingobium sp. ZW T5_29 TaxID=3378077 RepID=UPI0038543918